MALQIKSNPYLDSDQYQGMVNVVDHSGQNQLLMIKNYEHVYINELGKITFCHVFSVKVNNSEVLIGVSPVDNPRVHYLAKYEPVVEEVLDSFIDPPQFSELHTVGLYPN